MQPVFWSGISRDDARRYGTVIAARVGCSGGGCIWCGSSERGDEQYLSHSTGSRRNDSRRRAEEIILLTCLYRLETDLLSLGCLTGPAMGGKDIGSAAHSTRRKGNYGSDVVPCQEQ